MDILYVSRLILTTLELKKLMNMLEKINFTIQYFLAMIINNKNNCLHKIKHLL